MKKLKAIFQDFNRKQVIATSLVAIAGVMISTPSYADPGNADLGALVTEMQGGIGTIAAYGLIIVGACITMGITFFGGKWLWNAFRAWMSRSA